MRQQTTVTIDDNLFNEAARLLAISDKNQLVEMVLTELIQHKKPDMRELVGKIEISPDYDYKKLRTGSLNEVIHAK